MDLKDNDSSTSQIDIGFGEKIFRWEDVCNNCICPNNVPGVINFGLIEELLQKQLMKHEADRMLLETGIPVEKIHEIRIEFRKIIRIDHLWMLKNLRILKLGNNFIEKIENIECLVHLTELDLSFNKISKIENLDSLLELEILSLFSNIISVIENMDNMKKLKILSIGRNCIDGLENVIYLRRLPNLKSLNMAENICSEEENFRYYIAKFLPDLVYYEYKMITRIEKDIGDEIFHDEFLEMIKNEEEEIGKKKMKEKEEEEAKLHVECFVEFLNTRRLFESFFENDSEGNALLLIGEKAEELHTTYQENILKISKNIFDIGQEHYRIRQKERSSYRSSIETLQQQSQAEAIGYVENFLKQQSELFADVKLLGRPYYAKKQESLTLMEEKIKECNKIYEKMLNSIWKVLMKLEITLNDQMLEANEIYEHFLTDLINNFIEETQELFSNMRNSVTDYHDELQTIAENYYSTYHRAEEKFRNTFKEEIQMEIDSEDDAEKAEVADGEKSSKKWKDMNVVESTRQKWLKMIEKLGELIPAGLKPYIEDRETLANSLSSSRDHHQLLVDNREDLLISRARDWLKDSVYTMITNEIKRNRDKVLEISFFLQKQREEWESLSVISEAIFRNLLVPPTIGPFTSLCDTKSSGKRIQ